MPPRERYELVRGTRPYAGVYVIVRAGQHTGIGGRVSHLRRSKFAPADAPADDLSAQVATIKTDAGAVIHARADQLDVFELVSRCRKNRYSRYDRR